MAVSSPAKLTSFSSKVRVPLCPDRPEKGCRTLCLLCYAMKEYDAGRLGIINYKSQADSAVSSVLKMSMA